MDNFKGIDYLKKKLLLKATGVKSRYEYYEMHNLIPDLGISTPPGLENWHSVLGWCSKSVDSIADRLVFRGFDPDTDYYGLNEIFEQNNKDVLLDSAILGALISSCDFIYITQDDTGFPRLRVIDGSHATGIIDPITHMLKEGYAVLEYTDFDQPIIEAYLIPGMTYIYENGKLVQTIETNTPYPLLVPVIHRPDAVRPFGHSRISRACKSIVNAACRCLKRSEISAEFYSYPQRYVLGMDQEAEEMDKWRAAMSAMLRIDKDDDGDHPVVGQFQQQSQTPHIDQLRAYAGAFAGETGLTLDDLGYPSVNPSSAEAIKSSHETLRLAARKAQRDFTVGIKNAGYLAACLYNDFSFDRHEIVNVEAKWYPIFEPDAAMLSLIGDGIIKVNQAIPGYFDKDSLRDQTGIEPAADSTSSALYDFVNRNNNNAE